MITRAIYTVTGRLAAHVCHAARPPPVSEQPHHHGTLSYQGTFFGHPHTSHLDHPDP